MPFQNEVVDITIDPACLTMESGFGNRPERLDWFQDQALGMFIHWGLDVLLGTVPSHWMIGAAPALVDRFIREFPKRFEATACDPDAWARLARQAGMRYACFTAKHHSGFCMFKTATTPFQVLNTPLGRDVAERYIDAFRRRGVAPGLYFSPLDFHWCHTQGKPLHFTVPDVLPQNNPGLMERNLAQVRELLVQYGSLATLFFDGPPERLRELVWRLQPEAVVTRGAMDTPEQNLPDAILPGAWEACCTIGDGWSYKPTHDTVKSGTEVIEMLIRTRAHGGNLLLNVTPDPDGRIPVEQERVLQELGTWLFFNGEGIYDVRPWQTAHENGIWYTRSKHDDTVYAFITGNPWPYGHFGRHTVTLRGIRATEQSQIAMLGQCEILEHQPQADAAMRWRQDENGLHVDAMRCYRPYDNRQWPNPVAFRITNAERNFSIKNQGISI